jgi:hypothetical protein
MSYYDDEEEGGQNRPTDPAGQGRVRPPSGLRADFRADPAWGGRAAPQPPAEEPAASGGYPPEPPPPTYDPQDVYDEYVEPARGPATAGYRAPAPDPYQPRAQAEPPHYADDGYDHGYEGQQDYAEPPARRRGIVNAAIVAGGLAVFGGIIFYAYNQGMRAGTESVAPILRAEAGPTKIRPDDPGGMEVPHQDKLVYDRLNPSSSQDGGEVERLLPPPETPMERPRAEPDLPAEEPMMPMAEEGEGELAGARAPAMEQPAPAPVPQQRPIQQQPAYQSTTPAQAPTEPVQQRVPTTSPPPSVASSKPQQLVPPPAQTVAPKPAPQVAAPPKPMTPAPVPAPAATSGTVRLQVAAVDSEGKAATEWSRLQKKFPAELGGLSMRTVRVDLGAKGIFYRIQGGPVDEARARQICAALSAQGAGCVLVR